MISFLKKKNNRSIKEDRIIIDELNKNTFEPLRVNKYIVCFPEKYQIPQFASRAIEFMDSKINITLMEGVGTVYANRFQQMKNVGNIKIYLLDPYNVQVMEINLDKVKVESIIPHNLSYVCDKVWGIDVLFKYKDIEYKLIEV